MKHAWFPLIVVLAAGLVGGCLEAGGLLEEGGVKDIAFEKTEITAPRPAPGVAPHEGEGISQVPSGADRKVIRTARLEIEVEDFETASEEVEKVASDLGGFISESHSSVTDAGRRRGSITLRVPDASFQAAISRLESLGEVKEKGITGRDVTEEYIDLEARLGNYRRQEGRYLEILEKAETVEDVLQVEAQLERVRGEIERLEGRMRYLKDRIDLATVTVDLFEPEPLTRQEWGIVEALRQSIQAFLSMTRGIIVFIGWILPLLLVSSVLLLVLRWFRGRRKGGASQEAVL
jgi:hypothetical protein